MRWKYGVIIKLNTVRRELAFGIFRLLSLCIVLILFAILGFHRLYKEAGAISWEFITSAPTDGMTGGGIWPAIVGTFYLMVGSALFAFPDRGDERNLYE